MWERLIPAEWHDVLQRAPPVALARMALGLVPAQWPSSLHAFVEEAQAAQLEPQPAAGRGEPAGPLAAPTAQRHWRGASWKKRAEIERMAGTEKCQFSTEKCQFGTEKCPFAERTVAAARSAGTPVVIDVGSGKGYLSSLLSLEYGLQVSRLIIISPSEPVRA
jgi:hypothetical protein